VVLGFANYDPRVRLAGVILNKLGSQRHEDEIVTALEATGVPLLGALRRSDEIHAPSRHLGLVPVGERDADAQRILPTLAEWISDGVDLDGVVRVARKASPLSGKAWDPYAEVSSYEGPRSVIAAAAGQAFTFRYTETVELLAAAGVDVVDVDPLREQDLPENCAGLYFGGGFPEVHAAELSGNAALRAEVAGAIERGMPVVAECAGLLYLCRELDGLPMVGAVDATAVMTKRGKLGYRKAVSLSDNVLAANGQRVTGHEFHRTEISPAQGDSPAWGWDRKPEGFATPSLHASYLHVHWAGYPELASRFAAAVHTHAALVRDRV
jgi:cobyrinic acid a,c-diamide synthase